MMIMTTIVSCIWLFGEQQEHTRQHTAIRFLVRDGAERRRETSMNGLGQHYSTAYPLATWYFMSIYVSHGRHRIGRSGARAGGKSTRQRVDRANGRRKRAKLSSTWVCTVHTYALVSAHFTVCNSTGNFHLSGYRACGSFHRTSISLSLSPVWKATQVCFL